MKAGRQIRTEDRERRQGIKAGDKPSVVSQNEGISDSPADILPNGIASEVGIKRFIPTRESCSVMLLSERLKIVFGLDLCLIPAHWVRKRSL